MVAVGFVLSLSQAAFAYVTFYDEPFDSLTGWTTVGNVVIVGSSNYARLSSDEGQSDAYIYTTINASAYTDIELLYRRKVRNEDGTAVEEDDRLRSYWKPSGASSWTNIGNHRNFDFMINTVDLPVSFQDFDLKFVMDNVDDSTTEDFGYLDYVEVRGNPAIVPEPNTIMFMGMGLIGLLGFRRKFS